MIIRNLYSNNIRGGEMISPASDKCTRIVAGKYDIALDENPFLVRKTLNKYLELFHQLEINHNQIYSVKQGEQQQPTINDGYAKGFKQLRELSKCLKINKDNLREGELECNSRKNRYQDIIPFSQTRVALNGVPGVPGSDYINANFVSGSSGSPRAYIACQGPLKNTLNDFWRMIWETNVSVVVMACNQYESGQLKCEIYWPEQPNASCLYGNYEVTLVKTRQICDDFLIRKFSVKLMQNNHKAVCSSDEAIGKMMADSCSSCSLSGSDDNCDRVARSDGDSDSYRPTPSGASTSTMPTQLDRFIVLEERIICQFHYITWPDHGVPQTVKPILELLQLVREVQPAEDKPILVHCSAGCGRTGTICCVDYVQGLLRRDRLEPSFDLHNIISEMRRQRMSMVQTLEQYILCHRAVAALFADQLDSIQTEADNTNSEELPIPAQPEENVTRRPYRESSKPAKLNNDRIVLC